jgi:hypothetical protein
MTKVEVQILVDGKPATGTLETSGERSFKTKSRGYYATGKVFIGKKQYQVSCPIVEIGSKPSP